MSVRIGRRRVRVLMVTGAALLLVFVVVVATVAWREQRPDFGWDPPLASPSFPRTHPLVVVDEAHNNAATDGFLERYGPFGDLLRADGYEVRRGSQVFEPGTLDGVRVLVIANAAGAPKPKLGWMNLPFGGSTDEERGRPAFTEAEVGVVRDWVAAGGSLLLVADHAPFGSAAAGLATAFGVHMGAGFVEVPADTPGPLVFSDANGRLGRHPILSGAGAGQVVHTVMTFTGQSLVGPPDASTLLRLPDSAIEYVPNSADLQAHPAGAAQGLALAWGSGRVVVLGEAAMLTAQVYRGDPMGLNYPGNDNVTFALNTMHWLTGTL